MIYAKLVGDRLWLAREAKELKRPDVAEKTKYHTNTIMNLEHGKTKKINLSMVKDLCDLYGVSIKDIVNQE